MKHTYQPSVTRHKRTHGFRICMKTRGGHAVLDACRAKGRKCLAIQKRLRRGRWLTVVVRGFAAR